MRCRDPAEKGGQACLKIVSYDSYHTRPNPDRAGRGSPVRTGLPGPQPSPQSLPNASHIASHDYHTLSHPTAVAAAREGESSCSSGCGELEVFFFPIGGSGLCEAEVEGGERSDQTTSGLRPPAPPSAAPTPPPRGGLNAAPFLPEERSEFRDLPVRGRLAAICRPRNKSGGKC